MSKAPGVIRKSGSHSVMSGRYEVFSTMGPNVTGPTTLDPEEVAKFSELADRWWDPDGPFAPLHRFNPVRLRFLRDTLAKHFGRNVLQAAPFTGLSLLDLGCGGGLLSEPMARLGFRVLGCDAGVRNVEAAAVHARGSDLALTYRCTTAEDLAGEGERFDVVLAMEIVEHVSDLTTFIGAALDLLAPGGVLVVATINRTLKSLALAKIGAEYVLRWLPPGTHDWNRFVSPGEIEAVLNGAGAQILLTQGMLFNPLRWAWQLSSDTDVNYAVIATRGLACSLARG